MSSIERWTKHRYSIATSLILAVIIAASVYSIASPVCVEDVVEYRKKRGDNSSFLWLYCILCSKIFDSHSVRTRKETYFYFVQRGGNVGKLIKFTKQCVFCTDNCAYNSTSVKLDLGETFLYINDFKACNSLGSCYLFRRQFTCDDIVPTVPLLTEWWKVASLC